MVHFMTSCTLPTLIVPISHSEPSPVPQPLAPEYLVDEERKKGFVSSGAPVRLSQSTFLLPPMEIISTLASSLKGGRALSTVLRMGWRS